MCIFPFKKHNSNFMMEQKKDITKNNLIIDKYIILETVGKGAFGEVYKATRLKDDLDVAMKIEKKTAKLARLIPEYRIYKKLISRGCKHGIPKIYELIQTVDYNILTMELLGVSLEEIFEAANKKFSISTVLHLGIDIVMLIANVHAAGFIHRDIKPNNFLIGYQNKHKVYITDFGLSKEYMRNGKHIVETFNHNVIGTARYSSIRMHLGFEPSRRDDLEAIGYMLMYFLLGKLPWQGVCKKKDKYDIFEKIGQVKLETPLEKLCENCPKCFYDYLQYCQNLGFYETPNYKYLVSLFIDTIRSNNFICQYEWM